MLYLKAFKALCFVMLSAAKYLRVVVGKFFEEIGGLLFFRKVVPVLAQILRCAQDDKQKA